MTGKPAVSVRRADHVGFAVASLGDALRFWTKALGAKLVRTGDMGGDFLHQVTGSDSDHVRIALVEVAGQTVELLEYQGTQQGGATARPYDPGFAHLALVVDDIAAVLETVADHGWRPQGAVQTISGGPRQGTRVVYAVAPDGATIEFMQPPE